MTNSKGRVQYSDSPFVSDEGTVWWEVFRPDWWQGSTEFLIKRQLKVFASGIDHLLPGAVGVKVRLDKMIASEELVPSDVNDLEQDILVEVNNGSLPDMVLKLLWDAFTWGLCDWQAAVPYNLTWQDLKRRRVEYQDADVFGEEIQ
jgi:hypothetical protein